MSKYSTVVLSWVIGPPEEVCFDLSFRVRSGLTTLQFFPWSVVLNKTCAPIYRVCGSRGDISTGAVHPNRYFVSLAGKLSSLMGQGEMSRDCPALLSNLVKALYKLPA